MAYSKVERSTWNDERFRSWPRDTREVWFYLLTSPHMDRPGGRVGCYVLDPMYAAADISCPDDRWTPERVEEQLLRLEAEGRILWDPSARLVLLLHFFRHNQPENPNVAKGAAKDVDELPFSETVLKGLLVAIETHLPTHFEKDGQRRGECGAVIAARVRARLEKARPPAKINPSETVTRTVAQTVPARFAKQEHEQEQEQLTTSGSDDPEAPPRRFPAPESDVVALPTSPSLDSTEAARIMADFRAEAVTIILDELWMSTRDKPPARYGRDWNLARELDIWNGLVEHDPPEDVNGAMRLMRRVGGFQPLEGLSLLLFRSREPQCRDLYQRALQLHRKQVAHEAGPDIPVLKVSVGHG